jgi:ABC-type antimicrobial peptide transport system permease subunit
VLAHGVRLVLVGCALGLGGAWLVSRWMQQLLFRVSALDPWLLGAASAALGVVALAAAVIPAWRATRVDPVIALKA